MTPIAADHRFRVSLAGFMGALMAQFWLGMWVNLFVKIPTDHPGSNPPEYFGGVVRSVSWAILSPPSLWLGAHALLGLVLTLGGFGLLVRGIRLGSRPLVLALSIGALGILAAGFNGGSYLNYHEDFSSMIMASGLAIAVIAYAAALALAP